MLEDVGDPLPAGTICESSMHQNYILNMLTHDHFSFAVEIHSDQLIVDVRRRRASDLRPTIVRYELSVIEDMNPFCRFLLKCGVCDRKDHSQLMFQRENSSRLSNPRRCGIQRRFRATQTLGR